jgi:hypothetical protein
MPDPGYLLTELEFLEEEAAAVALGIESKTLADYRKTGVGPEHAVVGRKILYSKEALLAWLKAGGTRDRGGDVVAPTPMRRRA